MVTDAILAFAFYAAIEYLNRQKDMANMNGNMTIMYQLARPITIKTAKA